MGRSDALSIDLRVEHAELTVSVAFEAPPGITIMFGPSGSGKSTTLAAVAGLIRPKAGRIALGSEVWFDADKGVNVAIEKRRVAFVFQSSALFPHMTAAANVMYGMERSASHEERQARAKELLARFKVPHLADRKPRTFSGGEAQRVALARALAMKPHAVLMDEPFSAMHHTLRAELVKDVRSFVDEVRVPMIFVTHHRGEARALGDHGILIEVGKIVKTGDVSEIVPGAEALDA